METKFTKEYFIQKFEAIPDELWCRYTFSLDGVDGCHCALGHCGFTNERDTEEGHALSRLLSGIGPVEDINDAKESLYSISGTDFRPLGSTPKERILNALKLLT